LDRGGLIMSYEHLDGTPENVSKISRRRFFVHSAHQTVGVSAGLTAWGATEWAAEIAWAEPIDKPIELCLVSGSFEYKSDQSLAILQEYLEQQHSVRCSRAFAPSEEKLPGLENLDHCDAAIFFTRRLKIEGDALERVRRFATSGKPVLGLRTASHGFQQWLAKEKEIFGGDYQGHYGNGLKPQIELVADAQDHPILKGVTPFISGGSLYKNPKIASDTTVLLRGTIPGHTEPVAWTRQLPSGARVFYTSLGHLDDFRQASFLKLLANALMWALKR
jgi:type 1 glutamine amidotransferase